MVETDWREILSFSQRELVQDDKEKLCESLCWMEADDIELNFSDLKTLFRLAQDILKFKSEQVHNLLGQLQSSQRKSRKGKGKAADLVSPTKSSDSVLETIAHQEEMIKANKEILESLYNDIAELEERKNKLEADTSNADSESSRDALSEMDAIAQLENEVTLKNRHIRKLLGDIKNCEEENTKLKEKTSILKDKLTEATLLIENLTEKLFGLNSDCSRLKEILGKSEEGKAKLAIEIESLRKELFEKDATRESLYQDIKAKVQHWKNVARSKKSEIEALFTENTMLKENLADATQTSVKANGNTVQEHKIKELQEKLFEASNEIIESANLISKLREDNKELKKTLEVTPDLSVSDYKNESDDGKQRQLINKLKRKVQLLTTELHGAEEMIVDREKELTEISAQLQLVKSNDGIGRLIEGIKSKKDRLKKKDIGIKTLVQEVNHLNEVVNDLQLENEAMRLKLNIPGNEKISTEGIISKYQNIQKQSIDYAKKNSELDNKLLNLELENRNLKHKTSQLTKVLLAMGNKDKVEELLKSSDLEEEMIPLDGGGDSLTLKTKSRRIDDNNAENSEREREMQAIIDENEGLRKGLQEILQFLKDNSTTSSGVLALQCPSLESVLHSMEARHAAGWFAPHMTAVMELKAALGGKDALLSALHEARKETFEVMSQLSKESQKSCELEKKIHEIENQIKVDKEKEESSLRTNIGAIEFGSWMSDKDWCEIDINDKTNIENVLAAGSNAHENQLKHALGYFHTKFKELYERMTLLTVQTADDQNKWFIQEEEYKAQIENLQAKLDRDEDLSEVSPGVIIEEQSNVVFQRKCLYLEEAYKYIRTLNENMNTELLESKREVMLLTFNYEMKVQKLMLAVANLTDKLRNSISLDVFWKQNNALNEMIVKYRKFLDENIQQKNDPLDLIKRLSDDRAEILISCKEGIRRLKPKKDEESVSKMLTNIEHSVLTKQLNQVCSEIDTKNKQIEKLEHIISKLQVDQSKLIDHTLAATTKADLDLMKDQIEKLADENKVLKEQCQHVGSQLDIALLQLQNSQQKQLSSDMEVNLLRHQILDLQSTSDNKAIIARLSGEVLISHLQATDNHKKIERLHASLMKEKHLRAEAEEMLETRQKIFDVYCFRYDFKFKYMNEVLQTLRAQYQGSLPLYSIEQYLDNVEELSRKTFDVDEKLDEIESLRTSLMTKHSVYNRILDLSKAKCLDDEDSCPHKLQNIINEGIYSRELDQYKNKLETIEKYNKDLVRRCNKFEQALVLLNQGFEKTPLDNIVERRNSMEKHDDVPNMELEDLESDDDSMDSKRTVTLPEPQLLKPSKNNIDMTKLRKEDVADNLFRSPTKTFNHGQHEIMDVSSQTVNAKVSPIQMKHKTIQTDETDEVNTLSHRVSNLTRDIDKKNMELHEVSKVAHQRAEEIMRFQDKNNDIKFTIKSLEENIAKKDKSIEHLQKTIDKLRRQFEEIKISNVHDNLKPGKVHVEENKARKLVEALKQLDNDKNSIVAEYQELLAKEREDYAKAVEELNSQIIELRTDLDQRRGSESNTRTEKEAINKCAVKITELENKCFKSQAELDSCNAELLSYKTEMNRWKDLAQERLTKMEQLNSQLHQRHSQEVESYKAESDHWMNQLNETQKEHTELRTRLTEQKAAYVKQLAERDAHVEQLRNVIHGLKMQIMNMQTMMSVTDPSFDLSAIVEVDEGSEHSPASDRLELKFDSSVDMRDHDESFKAPTTSSAIWQEPVIERLRREKQLLSKQNTLLRRQIKALAARERRARLDANNLRNQVFRISTSGNKLANTTETAALHNKISCLQTQLMSSRRDNHSNVALWDKWKRAAQASERWQARFEEKCEEVKKLDASLQLTKASVSRLEKEKRLLLVRLSEAREEKLLEIEKQETEPAEKPHVQSDSYRESVYSEPPVSSRALMERVQAQQRRIAALEGAEKGKEYLVSEYERTLAEVTSLKGQVLKLESTLLEAQIRAPVKQEHDSQGDLNYWKSYCEMLKEENVQLTMKITAMETTPASASHHRVNDLEQTVLTLRALVSKLQSEQKSAASGIFKRSDSRPNSGRSVSDKSRLQSESYRIEIANLKRAIHEKDLLLERSKEMLKIAAEREDFLLRENAALRQDLEEVVKSRQGFLSA